MRMSSISSCRAAGLGVTLALLLAPAAASARTLGLFGDFIFPPEGITARVIVFDADTDGVVGTIELGAFSFGVQATLMLADQSRGYAVADRRGGPALFVLDLEADPPAVAGEIPLASESCDLALSPDERFLLVSSCFEGPIAVIELASATEIGSFDSGLRDLSVDSCASGAVLIAGAMRESPFERRVEELALDGAGALSATGKSFVASAISSSSTPKVECAPDATSGILTSTQGEVSTLLSFAIGADALTPISTRIRIPSFSDAVFRPEGSEILLRTGSFELDRLERFEYAPETASIGALVGTAQDIGGPSDGFGPPHSLALHPDGAKLYVARRGFIDVVDARSLQLLTQILPPNDNPFFEDLLTGLTLPRAAPLEAGDTVAIDIRPGTRLNFIHPRSRRPLWVYVLGSADFDVAEIDRDSVRFGPAEARPILLSPPLDLNRDGHPDRAALFRTADAGIPFGAREACVTGLRGSAPFAGCDRVRTLGH